MTDSVLVIVEIIRVMDPEQLTAYQGQARQQLLERGGKLLARGGETFEGAPLTGPVLVQRWPSEQAFRDWQESEDYRPLLALRKKAAELRLTIVAEV